jgi:glutamine amidotransferase
MTRSEVVIIDSGGANLASLQFALERLGARTHLSREAREIRAAPRVILPGVGSAGAAMQRLRAAGLTDTLTRLTQPLLGICLGMQLLYSTSSEGDTACLGVLPDSVRRLESAPGRPVPHMGWNRLEPVRSDPLLEGLAASDYLYFVHSYAAPVSGATLASARYGVQLAAVVRQGNFCGTQFHPERSAQAGARLLANFLRLE